ncbi:MAG TPA: catalase [Microscillaceae bacterium]|nr:catalase [Microscillaceae bacterium]
MNIKNILLVIFIFTLLSACNNTQQQEHTTRQTTHQSVKKAPQSKPNLANQVADVFEEKFGVHQGKRRNHIDGFCFVGEFKIKDKAIINLTKSKIFSEIPLKVIGRFSHKGGVKKDESASGEYGMAFEISLPDGLSHNFSMNTLDFFPVNTPEGFLQLMKAKVSGKKEDFAQLKKDHPEFVNYKKHYKNKPKKGLRSYANHQFNSINSFLFVNDKGKITPVRWSFVPRNEETKLDAVTQVDFYKETQKALNKHQKLVWDMVVIVANEDDPVNDASALWTGDHQKIVAATLTVSAVMPRGDCTDKNFDPLRLTEGIQPSKDPVLKFRSPAYAMSFSRRMKEKNQQ